MKITPHRGHIMYADAEVFDVLDLLLIMVFALYE